MFERIELAKEAWLDYSPTWLEESEANSIFETLRQELPWEQRPIYAFGKELMQPRLMAWGGELPYKYSGQTLPEAPLNEALTKLLQRASADCKHDFNHVVLNLYRNGRDNISYHSDNEPELGRNPLIASLSLGSQRPFVLQLKANRKHKQSFELPHGSLLVMGGTCQHTWRHALPKQPAGVPERINITFRKLMGPPGWREWKDGARQGEKKAKA